MVNLFRMSLAACLAVFATGCSSEPAPVEGEAPALATGDAPDRMHGTGGETSQPVQIACDLLDLEELASAFNHKLTFTRLKKVGGAGAGCSVSVAEVRQGNLILEVESEAAYAARKTAYLGQGQNAVPVSVGKEAFLINGSQLIAIDDQDRAITLAVSLITIGADLPVSKEEIAAGIEKVGRDTLSNLR